jgi:hypothetical protein
MMILYGLLFAVLIYLLLHYFYSVNYTPGVQTLYGSPVTQALFPGEQSLQPKWGYDKAGFMRGDSTKYGPDSFWPENIPYQPTKSGSGGPSPSGGMRDGNGYYPGIELRDGYDPLPTIRSIYDDSGIPEKKVWEVGWWGY